MEPGSSTKVNVPLHRNRHNISSTLVEASYVGEATVAANINMTATAVSLPSANNQLVLYTERPQFSSTTSVASSSTSQPSNTASTSSSSSTAPIEKLSRPMAFEKMESLVKEMQDQENGVPVRSQKIFLTSIPSAFMGYDLIEWLMERLNVEESEALNMGNQLCLHGYFFPVNDSKTLVVKDDSSLYRFQSPYYWPWRQQKAPDQIEYAIYLAKRSLRNKQRHGLEDYENEALASLNKNLKGKWDFIMMQAEEQIKLSKDRKKGDKIVSDSQERAYWRVHRPPPGQFTPLEPCPVPSRDRQGKPRKRTEDDWKREVKITRSSLGRNRMKMSAACESLVAYYETFTEYDPLMQPALPSNPWVSEDITFWQLNSSMVDIPTEKRVRRWAISIEELVKDPTGLIEFTTYLRKEYSHENIRFWQAVNDMRRSAHSQIFRKTREIYSEFLEPGAPCEINIDGKTMEKVQQGLKAPSRFTFDVAADHVYLLLLKKDCYPRFIRSEHYKNLVANAIQPSQKKRFFGFGAGKKKPSTTTPAQGQGLMTQIAGPSSHSSLTRRRGSDRSLSGSAHELAVCGVNKDPTKVPYSHSQSNLNEIPYRTVIYRGDMPQGVQLLAEGYHEPTKQLETTLETCQVCPWDIIESDPTHLQPPPPSPLLASASASKPKLTVDLPSIPFTSSSDIINTDVSERMKRSCGLRQNTVDENFHRLAPVVMEQRRASMTMAPRISDLPFNITPPLLITTMANNKLVTNVATSELSLVINKAESIEEQEGENEEVTESFQRQSTKDSGDVIEEIINVPVMSCEPRKASVAERQKSMDMSVDVHTSLPTSISTQTLPTEEFPDAPDLAVINQDANKMETTSVTQLESTLSEQTAPEIDRKTKGIKKAKSRSIEEKERKTSCGGKMSVDDDDERRHHKCYKLIHQQSQVSQDDDLEFHMTELQPGCVAPAPTPAPSIAPLAEVEADPTEDDTEVPSDTLEAEQKPESERRKKRREKKERQESTTSQGEGSTTSDPEKVKRNAICPWEDEEMTTTVETPFVKTYATLGYL